MVERSTEPVNSEMSWLLGSEGLKVPMPTRFFSEKAIRCTRTSSIRPPYWSWTIWRQ